MVHKKHKGFTLIEVIIYIALFSLLMGTAFVTAYQLIDGTQKLNVKTTTQEEGNFVMRKLDWALSGISGITTPTVGNISNTLTLTRYDGNTIDIFLTANQVQIKENLTGNTLPITTNNVK